MNNKFVIRIVILLLFLPTKFFSQNIADSKSIYKWFDSIVGVGNIGLYNGVEYKKEYTTLKGKDEFYLSSDFLIGNVVYDKQPYYNIQMKYDVYSDELIVKLPSEKAFIIIKLIKTKIEKFRIKKATFIGVYKGYNRSKFGFLEILYEDEIFKVYKDYKKNRKEQLDESFVYNLFETNIDNYLFFNNKYFIINTRRDFLKIFPNYRKEIMSFTKSNRELIKTDYDLFIIRLTKLLSHLISTNKLNS